MSSEFGRGIVVCLAKFSEHLGDTGAYTERGIREYARWTPAEKGRCLASALKYPHGDDAQKLARMSIFEIGERHRGSKEAAISNAIEMWMNPASDHFYDLDERAPQPLKELASLCLRIGHGFTGETWTMETVKDIHRLWKQSCLAVDQMLGVEHPDWGSY